MTKKKPTLKQRMVSNAMCYHNHITEEQFNKKTELELLAWVHPNERDEFAYQLEKYA